ncbi:hypothetical protein, partial [Nonomuraea angiospora]|uniref:hypothetical protein n=1 Tax=Nonomuraea angiospora TaxID=46172 RepID=UPI0029B41D74
AITEPMRAVRMGTPPINPEPATASMPAITAADVAAYDRAREEMTPDEWMEPLRTGGARVERSLRQTMRERRLLLVNRVSDATRRLRKALAKGGRR